MCSPEWPLWAEKSFPHHFCVCGFRSHRKIISHLRQFWTSIKINWILTDDLTRRASFYVVPKIYTVVRPTKVWFKRNPRQVWGSSREIWSRKLEKALLMRWDLRPTLVLSVHDRNNFVFQNSPYIWIKNLPSGYVSVVMISTAYKTYVLHCLLCLEMFIATGYFALN
jgi:hypothetical protein